MMTADGTNGGALATDAAPPSDIKIQSLNQEEFMFSSAHGATVEWLTRFFVSPSGSQIATLLRISDRLILWPRQVIPPGDYRILLSFPSLSEPAPVLPAATPAASALALQPTQEGNFGGSADSAAPLASGPPSDSIPSSTAVAAAGADSSVHKHHRWSEEEEAYLRSLPANYSDWGGLASGRFMSRVSPFAIRAKFARLQKDEAAPQH